MSSFLIKKVIHTLWRLLGLQGRRSGACFNKLSLISVLSANAFNGKTSLSKEILDLMNNNSDKTWPLEDNDGKKANSYNCEFLLVQLVTAKIIGYKLTKSEGKSKGP